MAQDSPSNEVAGFWTPETDPERCVHGLSPIAQCQACVAACPLAAFALEEEGLTLDLAACDGCGLCVPACPEQAIYVAAAAEPLVAPPLGADRAFLACGEVAAAGELGRVTCLHAISSDRLARLHRSGIRLLVTSHADCPNCRLGQATPLAARVADLNVLLADRDLPQLRLHRGDIHEWRDKRDEAVKMSRRSLFRAAFTCGIDYDDIPAATAGAAATAINRVAPGAVLAASDRATTATFAPAITPTACEACGACVEICPHGVISLQDKHGTDPRYEIDATGCTGCRLCIDACEAGALTLSHNGSARPAAIRLARGQCRVCASPFYTVKDVATDTNVCRICAGKPRHQKLFQVLP